VCGVRVERAGACARAKRGAWRGGGRGVHGARGALRRKVRCVAEVVAARAVERCALRRGSVRRTSGEQSLCPTRGGAAAGRACGVALCVCARELRERAVAA